MGGGKDFLSPGRGFAPDLFFNMPKKDNNPSLSEALFAVSFVESLKDSKILLPESVQRAMKDVESNDKIINSLEKFNNLFKFHCWISNNYLPAETVVASVDAALNNNMEKAEEILAGGVTAGIYIFIMHLQSASEFRVREHIFNTANRLYRAEEYLAVIPLLLTAMDGVVNDITKNLGLFSANVDLDVWDSITQHSDAFSYIHSEFLTKSRVKTNAEEIFVPYRNGILHGRDINFGNKLLAAKCWNLLFTLRTWYIDKKDEIYKLKEREERKNTLEKNKMLEKHLNTFVKRSYLFEPNALSDSPSYTCQIFLESWKHKQWGKIVPVMWHAVGKHLGKEAKDTKDTYCQFNLNNFNIIKIEHPTPSSARAYCDLEITAQEKIEYYNVIIYFVYSDEKLNSLPEGHPNARWYIVQNSLSKIFFRKIC